MSKCAAVRRRRKNGDDFVPETGVLFLATGAQRRGAFAALRIQGTKPGAVRGAYAASPGVLPQQDPGSAGSIRFRMEPPSPVCRRLPRLFPCFLFGFNSAHQHCSSRLKSMDILRRC